MFVGQQLGPFAIEKELGSGAMGTVYRGVYVKTGQRVAVKVMAPGLGTTNDNASARFDREVEILKQLKHPNIVRLFGHGKEHGTRYFAMEYVEGESLDRLMARRGRMSWEEVVRLGQQLCSALQHAHERGIVHRDLKPSNLMVLRDGTVKLADFGIAKDLDVTALTGANCTVGTAAYMSPEQCRGERDLTYKSDLYSLGVVFYELITGRKPFNADNAMEMFLKHVKEPPVPPARLVLDVPVWLDTLILGLMEKEPDKRPLNAAKVAQVLGEIQEKVEALQSAGVDIARARVIDRPRARGNADETDREVARTLSGKKGRRKKKQVHFYERLWFQVVGLAAILGTMGFILYLIFKPPSPEKLVQQAEALMKNPEQWDKARDGPIKDYLAYYAGRAELQDQTEKMRQWANQVDVHECDQKLTRMLQLERKNFNPNVHEDDEGESLGFKAAKAEDAGDLTGARKYWSDAREKVGSTPWGLLATQRLAQLDAIAKEEDRLKGLIGQLGKSRQDPKLEGPAQQAFMATRYEAFNDKAMARLQFEKLKKATAEQTENRVWYLLAAKKVKELDADKENWEKDRVKLIKDWLGAAKSGERLTDGFAICSSIVTLYGDNSDLKGDDAQELKPLVDEARQKAKELAETLGLR
jgi:serine/threonine-protein kinase